jgi:hypothetical protein
MPQRHLGITLRSQESQQVPTEPTGSPLLSTRTKKERDGEGNMKNTEKARNPESSPVQDPIQKGQYQGKTRSQYPGLKVSGGRNPDVSSHEQHTINKRDNRREPSNKNRKR